MLQLHPLPKGTTGFTSSANSLTILDVKPFIGLVYSILRGTMEWEDIDLKGKNYFYFSIMSDDQEYHVLLNAYFPYVGISRSFNNNKFSFMSSEEINNQFIILTECNYVLLGKEELDKELTDTDFLELDNAELEQLNYWKPRIVSEIIFNNWD
ncbi:hypothetical protein [Paenibacillus sp. NFR01]|uniref:hypothetical protein n=1 Tax=Paenibacillus sp. NFR01 TaxID=1566279 RepID=UPI00111336D8|nr:hypothetical protein [Paenibacillus sp. NFR01]